ncbi:hypothetical protein Tcan_04075, partial [Toxocara canis]
KQKPQPPASEWRKIPEETTFKDGNSLREYQFEGIIRPEEKTLLRRVAEIYTTLQTKKWNGAASIELLEDSDEERSTPLQARIKRGRKKGSLSNGTAMRDLVDAEKEKMRALVHQSFLQRLEQLPLAAAAAMAQGAFLLPQLLTASGSPSSQQQAAMLSSLFGVPSVSTATSTSTTSVVKAPHISGEHSSTEDVLNLSTKRSMSASSLERLQPSTSNAVASVSATPQPASALINTLNFSELLALANLPPDEERSTPLQARIKRGRKKGSLSNGTAMRDLVDAEKEKMRALVHQSFLQRLEQLPLAAAAAMAQGAFLPA